MEGELFGAGDCLGADDWNTAVYIKGGSLQFDQRTNINSAVGLVMPFVPTIMQGENATLTPDRPFDVPTVIQSYRGRFWQVGTHEPHSDCSQHRIASLTNLEQQCGEHAQRSKSPSLLNRLSR